MHESVLLKEALEALNIKENSIIVDCTLGFGGHSSEILKRLKTGKLYAFDQDQEAIFYSQKRLEKINSNFEIIASNFQNIKEELQKRGITKVDGILFDLGVSSPQLDQKERGFSFHQDAKLDMRMDQQASLTAYDVVNNYSQERLITIFREYGEEKFAVPIAKKIVEQRKTQPITTTLELVEVIKQAVPFKYMRDHHPARKVFQAIRMEVNHELEVFEKALTASIDLLTKNGRICVITFHSLEDKLCKEIFTTVSKIDDALKNMPVIPEEYLKDYRMLPAKKPTKQEIEHNRRSRSAKLRILEKIR